MPTGSYAHMKVVVAASSRYLFWFFGHNSVPLRRIWTKLGGNRSHESPGPFKQLRDQNNSQKPQKNRKHNFKASPTKVNDYFHVSVVS